MSHVVDGPNGVSSGFPAPLFRIDGDPGAISDSGRGWIEFGARATDSAARIRSLDTTLFIGPEADSYRHGLHQDLAPHLDRTGEAYTCVGSALTTFAHELSGLQEQMAPLTVRAPYLWDDVQTARATLLTAQSADHTHTEQRLERTLTTPLDLTAPAPPPDDYVSETGPTSAALSIAQQAWDHARDQAARIKTALTTAIETCCHTIHEAEGMRFADNPSLLGAIGHGFTTFITDHATALTKISAVLKTVSAISGVLAFIPVVDLVAAPLALATATAALAIDTTLKLTTGQGNWAAIAIDAALLALPGIAKVATRSIGAARGVDDLQRGAEIASSGGRTAEIPEAATAGGTQLTTQGDEFGRNAARARPRAGYHDVIVHGSEIDFGAAPTAWADGTNFDHRLLAQIIRRDSGYDGGPIRLVSCRTGAEGATAAQNLANKIGVEGVAPTDIVWAWPSGRLAVGADTWNLSGGWARFHPGGRRT